jgi:tRNA(Ile)-lysidine synthase
MVPEPVLLERFRSDLEALIDADARTGIAVSGGPDSMALLLLAAAARPGKIEAATVDHALRAASHEEAEMVSSVCAQLQVPHAILTVDWDEAPASGIQERAREARYRLLGEWVKTRGLAALLTGHHADDQAETFLMRLNRGAGARGLAGMRPVAIVPGTNIPLIRPLLGWRRSELLALCAAADLSPAADPSNSDEQFERVRVRQALAGADWLDPAAVARSAANLASADEALDWMASSLALVRVTDDGEALRVEPEGLPTELQRRLLLVAFARFEAPEPRGPELARAIEALAGGRTVTLSGLKLEGGSMWRVTKAPPRR